jgi:hypothetical protein
MMYKIYLAIATDATKWVRKPATSTTFMKDFMKDKTLALV